jgi:hypothetical protein
VLRRRSPYRAISHRSTLRRRWGLVVPRVEVPTGRCPLTRFKANLGAMSRPTATTPDELIELTRQFCATAELPCEPGTRPGEVVVTLPGEKKLKTVVSLIFGQHVMSLRAFVIRNPDENHEAVYRYLLRHNLRTAGLAYAIDKLGDVYVAGKVPLPCVDDEMLDRLFGGVLEAADAPFNDLLVMGFLESMKKEWAWRVERGESLRNLEAFRHLLDNS